MRLPPHDMVRAVHLDDDVLVYRGGVRSLDDNVLTRTLGDCWTNYGFFGLSVFADPYGGGVRRLGRQTPLARRQLLRYASAGALRAEGFAVIATFTNEFHFSIVLPDVSAGVLARVRNAFSTPILNPSYKEKPNDRE